GDLVFLHEVAPGVADRSYGIQVARLAGLPPAVVARAREVLEKLEQGGKFSARKSLAQDLPLFSETHTREFESASRGASEVEKKLAEVVPDELSARDALALVYELRNLLPR
ncbi:MAG: MutS-related protein, partial [Methylocella sp.]